MSGLRSALDELRAEDVGGFSHEELEGDLGEIERAMRALQLERARRVAEVERRGSFREAGFLTVVAWLAHVLLMGTRKAGSIVRQATALEQMPGTAAALSQGEISGEAVRVMVDAREAHPEEFGVVEEALVDAARRLPVRELRYAVEYWRQAAHPTAAEGEAERRFDRRRLHVSPTLDGMVRVDGDLDPETGQTFLTALRSITD